MQNPTKLQTKPLIPPWLLLIRLSLLPRFILVSIVHSLTRFLPLFILFLINNKNMTILLFPNQRWHVFPSTQLNLSCFSLFVSRPIIPLLSPISTVPSSSQSTALNSLGPILSLVPLTPTHTHPPDFSFLIIYNILYLAMHVRTCPPFYPGTHFIFPLLISFLRLFISYIYSLLNPGALLSDGASLSLSLSLTHLNLSFHFTLIFFRCWFDILFSILLFLFSSYQTLFPKLFKHYHLFTHLLFFKIS